MLQNLDRRGDDGSGEGEKEERRDRTVAKMLKEVILFFPKSKNNFKGRRCKVSINRFSTTCIKHMR